jgi:hypothetical protein
MRAHRGSKLLAWTVAMALPLLAGCGGDDGTPHNPVPGGGENPLLGTWWALSITVIGDPGAGDAVVDDGLEFSINFNEAGEYAVLVNNDDPENSWVCGDTASCEWWGYYTISGSTLAFDEGTADEVVMTFEVVSDTLTVDDGTFIVVAEKTT